MNVTDELERLSKLHQDGTLSDDEFAQAKRKLLNSADEPKPVSVIEHRVAEPASRDFAFQTVMIVLAVILLVVFLLALPHFHHGHWFYH